MTSPAQYILLTTFTKDGRPKPTAIWAAPDGDGLIVITQASSWKVKRIRNTPGHHRHVRYAGQCQERTVEATGVINTHGRRTPTTL